MRTILAAVDSEPGVAFDVDELCGRVYPYANRIEEKHRVAVIGAMRRVKRQRDDLDIANDGHIRASGSSAPGRGLLILYRPSNPDSAADRHRRTAAAVYEELLKSAESQRALQRQYEAGFVSHSEFERLKREA